MKVTIEIDDSLLAEVQALAIRQGMDLSALVESALRERVRSAAPAVVPARNGLGVRPLRINVAGKGGMHPWIDPGSNESMLDAMDGFDDP